MDETTAAASPLSGGYLLIVLAEPHSEQHKQILLQQLAKGLASWDGPGTQIDIDAELRNITAQCPQGEELRSGEKLVQLASDSLVTEILIHPQLSTLKQCMRNLLASFTRHRHVIHAGYTLSGTGSWIVQDGTYELSDFMEILQDSEVQKLYRAYYDSITTDVHCGAEGHWSLERFNQESAIKSAKISINPAERWDGGDSLAAFVRYISDILPSVTLDHLLEPSDVVGNIRFSHPTLYVFPGGQGDSCLFGISGFNILVDGGFGRKPCFWDFTRHLDRLDAVVMTRNNPSSLSGLTGAICRKASSPVYPQIGHVFCNLPTSEGEDVGPSPSDNPLTIHLTDLCRAMSAGLSALQLKAQPIYRTASLQPINLYHKVGHGTLDMYVISPSADSPEVKELLRLWRTGNAEEATGPAQQRTVKMGGKEFRIPLLDMLSVCALLVWQPADPAESVTRLLFPGSAPQQLILEGLERLKHLECLKTPVCLVKNLTPSKASAPKAKTSPRHEPAKPIRKEMKPKESDGNNKSTAVPRPAAPAAKSIAEVKADSAMLSNPSSRTGSGELHITKKTETKTVTSSKSASASTASKPVAAKKDPTLSNGEVATSKAAAQKVKKEPSAAATSVKAVEAKVQSFKNPASLKRAEENSKLKKTSPNESLKEKPTVSSRSQSQTRGARSASTTRGATGHETKAIKKVAEPSSGSGSPAKHKAVKVTSKPSEGTTTPKPSAAKKERPKTGTPTSKTSKEASAKAPASAPPSTASRAVKRPAKTTAAALVATTAATVAVAIPHDEQSGEPPIEEVAFGMEEAPQAASSPIKQEEENAESVQPEDEASVIAAIESQILQPDEEDEQIQVEVIETEEGEEGSAEAATEVAEGDTTIGQEAAEVEQEGGEEEAEPAAEGEAEETTEITDEQQEEETGQEEEQQQEEEQVNQEAVETQQEQEIEETPEQEEDEAYPQAEEQEVAQEEEERAEIQQEEEQAETQEEEEQGEARQDEEQGEAQQEEKQGEARQEEEEVEEVQQKEKEVEEVQQKEEVEEVQQKEEKSDVEQQQEHKESEQHQEEKGQKIEEVHEEGTKEDTEQEEEEKEVPQPEEEAQKVVLEEQGKEEAQEQHSKEEENQSESKGEEIQPEQDQEESRQPDEEETAQQEENVLLREEEQDVTVQTQQDQHQVEEHQEHDEVEQESVEVQQQSVSSAFESAAPQCQQLHDDNKELAQTASIALQAESTPSSQSVPANDEADQSEDNQVSTNDGAIDNASSAAVVDTTESIESQIVQPDEIVDDDAQPVTEDESLSSSGSDAAEEPQQPATSSDLQADDSHFTSECAPAQTEKFPQGKDPVERNTPFVDVSIADSGTTSNEEVTEEFTVEVIQRPVVVPDPELVKAPSPTPNVTKKEDVVPVRPVPPPPSQQDDDSADEVEEEAFQQEIKTRDNAVPITPTDTKEMASSSAQQETDEKTKEPENKPELVVNLPKEPEEPAVQKKESSKLAADCSKLSPTEETANQSAAPENDPKEPQPTVESQLDAVPDMTHKEDEPAAEEELDEVVEEVPVKSDYKQIESSPLKSLEMEIIQATNLEIQSQTQSRSPEKETPVSETDTGVVTPSTESTNFSGKSLKEEIIEQAMELHAESVDETAASVEHETSETAAQDVTTASDATEVDEKLITKEEAEASTQRAPFVAPLTASTPIDGPDVVAEVSIFQTPATPIEIGSTPDTNAFDNNDVAEVIEGNAHTENAHADHVKDTQPAEVEKVAPSASSDSSSSKVGEGENQQLATANEDNVNVVEELCPTRDAKEVESAKPECKEEISTNVRQEDIEICPVKPVEQEVSNVVLNTVKEEIKTVTDEVEPVVTKEAKAVYEAMAEKASDIVESSISTTKEIKQDIESIVTRAAEVAELVTKDTVTKDIKEPECATAQVQDGVEEVRSSIATKGVNEEVGNALTLILKAGDGEGEGSSTVEKPEEIAYVKKVEDVKEVAPIKEEINKIDEHVPHLKEEKDFVANIAVTNAQEVDECVQIVKEAEAEVIKAVMEDVKHSEPSKVDVADVASKVGQEVDVCSTNVHQEVTEQVTSVMSQLTCDPMAKAPSATMESSIHPPTEVHLKPEALTVDSVSGSSSASVTPKSPLSPNVIHRPMETSVKTEETAIRASDQPSSLECDVHSTPSAIPKSPVSPSVASRPAEDLNVKAEETTARTSSQPSSLESDVRSVSSSSHTEKEDDGDDEADSSLAPSTPTAASYLAGYEGVTVGGASKLSTIASSDGEQQLSLDSNFSSKTYEKLSEAPYPHPEESAFSSGPSSWDVERENQAAKPSGCSAPVENLGSDHSATSSLDMSAQKRDEQDLNTSAALSSSFSTDRSSSRGESEINKDSLSSIQTSTSSSEYHLETKVDDSASASSAQSDYSDQHRALTPRSDISSASETTTTTSQLIQPVLLSEQPSVEVKACKVELADPKVAPHNLWLKEKEQSSSPNPFSDRYDDSDHQPDALDIGIVHSSAVGYYAGHHSDDIDSDRQSDSQSMIQTAEYTDDGYSQRQQQQLAYDETHAHRGRAGYHYESSEQDDNYSTDDVDPYGTEYTDEHYHGDHQNGNAYHYYEPSATEEITAQQHGSGAVLHQYDANEDLNRNGRTPSRDQQELPEQHLFTPSESTRLESNSPRDERTSVHSAVLPPVSPQQQQQQHEETLASWGKPLGLPAPVVPTLNGVLADNLKKSAAASGANGSPLKRPSGNGSNSAAPKSNSISPFYVDLAYIPHHSDPRYSDAEFFRRVRARHYVLSTLEPSTQVLDALLAGKQSWTGDDKDLDVTIIPTYDSEALALWVSANEDLLARNRIDLAPSASRCTINLQDHETSCSAYRLEF